MGSMSRLISEGVDRVGPDRSPDHWSEAATDRDPTDRDVGNRLSALVIATGSGVSMHSSRPKPLHLLCGRPMVSYVLESLARVGVEQGVVVTGVSGDRVSKRVLEDPPAFALRFVEQPFDRGDAEAAAVGLSGLIGPPGFDEFEDDGDILVVPADLPLLGPGALWALLDVHRAEGSACTVMTVDHPHPEGCDRVLRDRHGQVIGIARDIDLVGQEVSISEVPMGVYCIRRGVLSPAVRRIPADPVDGSHQLIDLLGVLSETGNRVASARVADLEALTPVDNRRQLAEAEAALRRRINRGWLDQGVTMIDPERTYIDATVQLGTDVTLFPGTILQGSTSIGDGCDIGPDTRLDRCRVGRDTVIEMSMGRLASVGDRCRVGPFAALEPGAELADDTITGPFFRPGP